MKSFPTKSESTQRARGFTLTEMLIALVLVSFLSIGLMGFMVDVSRGIFWGTEKAEISEDVRSFTMRLAAEARSANDFYIYSSFAAENRDAISDRVTDSDSGDCLVLVNTEYYPDTSGTLNFTGVVVYYRKADDGESNTGPVHRFEWEATGPSQYYDSASYSVEQVLGAIAPTDTNDDPVVIELSRGVANGRLFSNFNKGRVCVVSGEILHGNQVKEVTNTYNLSISPRV